jgi:uncharacterized protein (DUF3084 family)
VTASPPREDGNGTPYSPTSPASPKKVEGEKFLNSKARKRSNRGVAYAAKQKLEEAAQKEKELEEAMAKLQAEKEQLQQREENLRKKEQEVAKAAGNIREKQLTAKTLSTDAVGLAQKALDSKGDVDKTGREGART